MCVCVVCCVCVCVVLCVCVWVGCLWLLRVVLLLELAWSGRRSWGLVVSACPMSVGCRLIPILVSGMFVRRVRLEAFCAFGGLAPVFSAGDYSASVSDY